MLSSMAPAFSWSLAALVFTEGLAAFISPCILPMFPVYIMYLSGGSDLNDRKRLLINTLFFILGFTIIFVLLGAGASALGSLLNNNRLLLQRVSGGIIIILGLHYTGLLNIKALNYEMRFQAAAEKLTPLRALLFGLAFSFGWTPCLGPMLGSAMMIAGNTSTLLEGMFLLFIFSMGLGVPFFIFTMLYSRLKQLVSFMNKHHGIIKKVAGGLLILTGLLLLFDVFGYYAALFS
ncbi:MAG: cytochrome c biogenesis CcdA family protein [Christensenellales bacterium]|jgi:cytochrome c-type biogenesis protein